MTDYTLGHILLSLSVLLVITVSSTNGSNVTESSQCSLSSLTTCHQYTSIRRSNITCQVSNKFSNCDQLCHAGRCNMTCIAPDQCSQRCYAGACESLTCSSRKCMQHCLRSKCNLKCNSEECVQESDVAGTTMSCKPGTKTCIQNCKSGKCIMNCPSGVRYCKQTCIYGNCIMLCKAAKCARSCRDGRCIYDYRPQKPRNQITVINNCNYGYVNRSCYQECIHGNCDVISPNVTNNHSQVCFGGQCNLDCVDNHKCSQVCVGERCPKLTCQSGVCIQECVSGGCEMDCVSAGVCSQICRGGNCTMKCLNENTRICQQYCTGGDCKMQCNAKRCIPSCFGGNCNYKHLQPIEIDTSIMCDSVTNGVCQQDCISYEGCNLHCRKLDGVHSCNQSCHAGYCNLNCTNKDKCVQNCAAGHCESMVCNSKVCKQVCNWGKCGAMRCNAERCVQMCFGANCHMTCPAHVKYCHQGCMTKKGPCIFDCHAETCTIALV